MVACLPHGQAHAQKDVRDTIGKWVEVRKNISEEKSDWRMEESMLRDTRELLRREIERLDASIEDMEDSATAADKERAELTSKKERLNEATDVLKSRFGNLEERIKGLSEKFPTPLSEKIAPIIRRIPKDPEDTNASFGERVQNIVGILSQADKFNNDITQTSESREIEEGRTVEVRTLYWGLGGAYYVDASGAFAGIGRPGEDEWEWPRMKGAAPGIRRLIDVAEGSAEIQFVEVPASIE